ncbi:hypothetical protein AB6G29_09085 [Providencia hangzhouensis]|uniref:hypothetical protein n=1 Tax=Providencia hangzhouensis TaxID=3031799 RepID=UPI0034DDA5B5
MQAQATGSWVIKPNGETNETHPLDNMVNGGIEDHPIYLLLNTLATPNPTDY